MGQQNTSHFKGPRGAAGFLLGQVTGRTMTKHEPLVALAAVGRAGFSIFGLQGFYFFKKNHRVRK